MQIEALPRATTTASCCRSAPPSSTGTCRSASTRILRSASSVEAAEPLGVPVLPSLPFGLTPYFAAYPGSPTPARRDVRRGVGDLLDSLATARASAASCSSTATAATILPARFAVECDGGEPGRAGALPQLVEQARRPGVVQSRSTPMRVTPPGSRTSRGRGSRASTQPHETKPMADLRAAGASTSPAGVRELLGDGSLGGLYERSDDGHARDLARRGRGGSRPARGRLAGCLISPAGRRRHRHGSGHRRGDRGGARGDGARVHGCDRTPST